MLTLPPNPLSDALAPDIDLDVVKVVRLAMPRCPSESLVMRITWDNMGPTPRDDREAFGKDHPGVALSGFARRPDSSRLITVEPSEATPATVEAWAEETAWALGAGMLIRWCKPPGPRNIGLLHSFGKVVYEIMGEDDVRGEGGPETLLSRAAAHGYWQWEFNSAYRKADGHSALFFPSWRKHDPSLEDDGARRSQFPGWVDEKLLTLAKSFEESDEPDLALAMPYNFVTLRIDPKLI